MQVIEKYFLKKSSTSNLQYDFLDGLRGIAVLFVFLSHLSNNGLHLFYFVSFSGTGKYGVFLFFVLSAFLLTHPFIRKTKSEILNSRIWLNYALRRLFRIFPLYVFMLLLSSFMSRSGIFTPINKDELYQHITLQAGKAIFWTIPVEFKYYLVLPIVVFIFRIAFRKSFISSMCTTGIAIILISAILWPAEASKINTVSLGPYLPIFLLGSFSALVHNRLSNTKSISLRHVKWIMESVAFLLITISLILVPNILELISNRSIGPNYFHKSFLLFGALWSSFVVACFHGVGYVYRVLSMKILRFTGVISFSLYLWHKPVIHFFSYFDIPLFIKAWLIILVAMAVSAFSYLVIEKPFLKIKYPLIHNN